MDSSDFGYETFRVVRDKRDARKLAFYMEAEVCSAEHADLLAKLKSRMESELKAQGDPRMFGKGGVFDGYPYSSQATNRFYERYMAGEKVKAGWVSPTDFEPKPLD